MGRRLREKRKHSRTGVEKCYLKQGGHEGLTSMEDTRPEGREGASHIWEENILGQGNKCKGLSQGRSKSATFVERLKSQ